MIGIYTPYRRGETTFSALCLADYAMRCGLGVKLATGESIVPGVHSRWDSRVRRAHDISTLSDWARGCDYLVWFDPEVFTYTLLQHEAPRIKHFLVPSWHRITMERLIESTQYFQIVLPTNTALRHWIKVLGPAPSAARFRYCPWDGGVEPTVRESLEASPELRLFVWLSSSAIRDFGHGVADVLVRLLRQHLTLRVTVYRECAFSRRLLARFRRLSVIYGERFLFAEQLKPQGVPGVLRGHDLTWLPATRADFGTDALVARACGAPPVTWQLPPFDTCVVHKFSGIQIPCERTQNWFGAPVAVPSVERAVCVLGGLIEQPKTLAVLRSASEHVTGRARTFEEFWSRAWELEE